MGAKFETLIRFEKVIDYDCGNYEMGEIDVGSMDLEGYLRQYGDYGYNQLTGAIVIASNRILEARRNVLQRSNPACAAKSI